MPQDNNCIPDITSKIDKSSQILAEGANTMTVPVGFPPLGSKDVEAQRAGKKRMIRNYMNSLFPGNDYDPFHTVSREDVIPVEDLTDEMRTPLQYLQAFVDSSDQRYLIEKDNPSHFIKSFKELQVVMMKHDIIFHFMPGMTIDSRMYFECLRQEAETVDRFSMTPEYNRDPSTFYLGDGKTYSEPNACQTNGSFRRLMGTFTTASLKDEYRLAAGFLSPFLSRNLDARRPLFGIVAPSRSAGKTTVVTMGARIIQGQDPLLMQGDSSDGCVNNGLSSLGNRFVLIDNLAKPSTSRLTKLSVQVTNPNIKAWFIHTAHLRAPNNKVYFATFCGEESFNADFLARLLIIRLKDKRELTTTQHTQIMKDLDKFYENREEVINDIMAGIATSQQFHDQDTPYTVIAPEKNGQWADEVARLLHVFYPEVGCFDFGLSVEDKEYDAERQGIMALPERLSAKYGSALPSMKFRLPELALLIDQIESDKRRHPDMNLRSLAQKMPLLQEVPGYKVSITAGHARERWFQFEKIRVPEEVGFTKGSGE